MKKKWCKTIILVFLILTSFYQTAKLWFDDFSSYNFFMNKLFVNKKEQYNELSKKSVIFKLFQPLMIAIYQPESEYFSYINKADNKYINLLYQNLQLLQEVFKYKDEVKGPYLFKHDHWNDLWQKNAMFMKIPYDISVSNLLEDLSMDGNNEDEFEFNYIVLIPSKDKEASIVCYLINTKTSMAKKIITKNSNKVNEVIQILEQVAKTSNKSYQASKKINIAAEKFSENVFIHSYRFIPMIQYNLNISIPFLNQSHQLEEKKLKKYMKQFFINPEFTYDVSKVTITDGNEDIYVKYNEEKSIIEYKNNVVKNYEKQNVSINEGYKKAVVMLQKDEYLNKSLDWFLAGYKEKKDNIEYYFDYKITDNEEEYNIVLSNELKKKLDMEYPIKIVVSRGEVITYKRWVIDIGAYSYNSRNFQYDARVILDKFYETYPNHTLPIADMFLGYYISDINNQVPLQWIIKSDKIYPINFD